MAYAQQQPMMAPQALMIGPQQPMMVMQMQGESCRNSSRVVAWIDIIFGVIDILCGGVIILWLVGEFKKVNNANQFLNSELGGNPYGLRAVVPTIYYIILFFAAIGFIVSIIEIGIACGLLTATEITTQPFQAIEKAKCWRCYHIFLLIFSLINGSITIAGYSIEIGGFHVVTFFIHCVFIFIVHSFIQELHRVGGVAPMMLGGGNPVPMAYTTTQYQQNSWPSQYQQQGQYQYQQQPQQTSTSSQSSVTQV